jgi:hypothetical protein
LAVFEAVTRNLCSAAIIALLTMSRAAHATENHAMTVGELKEFCTASDHESRAACRFFIYGVFQGIRLGIAEAKDTGRFCLPDDLSLSSMETIVKVAIGQDLMLFPKDSDLEASGFIGAAMIKAFPCRRAKP